MKNKVIQIILMIMLIFCIAVPNGYAMDEGSTNERGSGSGGSPGGSGGGGGGGGYKPKPKKDDKPCGSPVWDVNMVNMNLYVTDIPIYYTAAIGPSVNIKLSYNSMYEATGDEPFGNKWTLNYTSHLEENADDSVTVINSDGRVDVFASDGEGGYIVPYKVYNRLEKTGTSHYKLKFVTGTVYEYKIPSGVSSTNPLLTKITDAHNLSLSFSYNSLAQLTTITDAQGRHTTIHYTDGLIYQVDDPFGRHASFEHDVNRNLTRITDMGGYWAELDYDTNSYLKRIESPRGQTLFNIEPSDEHSAGYYPAPHNYMGENYRITVTLPTGDKEEYYYCGVTGRGWYVSPKHYVSWISSDINNYAYGVPKTYYYYADTDKGVREEITKVVFPEGNYITYEYDSKTGFLKSRSDSMGNTWRYGRNELGLITSIADPKHNTTTFQYYSNQVDLWKIANSLGSVTFSYNNVHDITFITDQTGKTRGFAYNSFGQLTSITEGVGSLNIKTEYNFNVSTHLLESITRAGSTLKSYTYDLFDRPRTVTDATGLTLTYDYNNLNHITRITWPDTKFMEYEYSGCCPKIIDSITNRAGKTINYTYDGNKQLIQIKDPANQTIDFKYDPNGNLEEIRDQLDHKTSFSYDHNDRLVKKIYNDGKYIKYEYDPNTGLLAKQTNARNIETSYFYDENYNLTFIDYSDSTPDVTIIWDNYNRVDLIQDGTGTYDFEYYANSQLHFIDGPLTDDTITYNYDAAGRLDDFSIQKGQNLNYTYDQQKRLSKITVGTQNFTYDYETDSANPLIKSLTRPNTLITEYQYDFLNRLEHLVNKNKTGTIINQFDYTYNSQDQIESENVTNGASPMNFTQNTTINTHNTLNQLTESTNPNLIYAYDDDGNMTGGYTKDGYLFTAIYDAENRIKEMSYTDETSTTHKIEYHYRWDNLLVQLKKYKNAALTENIHIVRNGFLPIQERDSANTIIRQYTFGINLGGGIGGLLNLNQNDQDYTYLYDGRGNINTLLDKSQAIMAKYAYDSYGNLIAKSGIIDQPFRFSTKRYDDTDGLYYYGYRFYIPKNGRWLNRDPLGEVNYFSMQLKKSHHSCLSSIENKNANTYAFTYNNPISQFDPDGDIVWAPIIGGAIVGAVTGGMYSFLTQIGDPCGIDFGKVFESAFTGAVFGGITTANLITGTIAIGAAAIMGVSRNVFISDYGDAVHYPWEKDETAPADENPCDPNPC